MRKTKKLYTVSTSGWFKGYGAQYYVQDEYDDFVAYVFERNTMIILEQRIR